VGKKFSVITLRFWRRSEGNEENNDRILRMGRMQKYPLHSKFFVTYIGN